MAQMGNAKSNTDMILEFRQRSLRCSEKVGSEKDRLEAHGCESRKDGLCAERLLKMEVLL